MADFCKKLKKVMYNLYYGKCWVIFNFIQVVAMATLLVLVIISTIFNKWYITGDILEGLISFCVLFECILKIILFKKEVLKSQFFWIDLGIVCSFGVIYYFRYSNYLTRFGQDVITTIIYCLRQLIMLIRGLVVICEIKDKVAAVPEKDRYFDIKDLHKISQNSGDANVVPGTEALYKVNTSLSHGKSISDFNEFYYNSRSNEELPTRKKDSEIYI